MRVDRSTYGICSKIGVRIGPPNSEGHVLDFLSALELFQEVHCALVDTYDSNAVPRFWRLSHYFGSSDYSCGVDSDLSFVEIDLVPGQAEKLSSPHAGLSCEDQYSVEAVIFRLIEECVQLGGGPVAHFLAGGTWLDGRCGWVCREKIPSDGVSKCFVEESSDVVDAFA
jgi:hypothetical protein